MNSGDYLRAAWAATIRGDTAERDRLCELGKIALRAEERSARIRSMSGIMQVDFYVTKSGVAFSTKDMMGKA